MCDRNNIGLCLVAMDIEKAFDSLDHKSVLATLKKNDFVKTLSPGLRYY